ncbi:CoA pyrophosphatase [Colwelliaceae bacterium 6441]
MTKDQFLQRFQLSQLVKSKNQETLLANPQLLRQSAVLIALFEENDHLQVLLTKRALHLKHHGGQISFPGGKVEYSDKDYTDTALREADEEIGLKRSNCQIVGQLHPYRTISGFSITPIVALLRSKPMLVIDPNEVAETFHVPLKHFLNKDQHYSVSVHHKTGNQSVHFMPYKSYNIWGATAAIMLDLSQHIQINNTEV